MDFQFEAIFEKRSQHGTHHLLDARGTLRFRGQIVAVGLHPAGGAGDLEFFQLGFEQVTLMDEDLGRSGSGLVERVGFQQLVGAVCAGSLGAITRSNSAA